MVDKTIGNGYIWYSGATDITGKNLAAALGMKHGNKKPDLASVSLILGWGAKTDKTVDLGKTLVLNHPNKIRQNRNKLESLSIMRNSGVNVADFVDSDHLKNIGKKDCPVKLPVIGRSNFHQGGKGFWNCPTMTHVLAAADEGAGYFQNLIEIKDEYRLHTFCGKVIHAVKKVKRSQEEMETAFIKHELDRQKGLAEKNGDAFDEKTAMLFLTRQAKKFAQDGANMLIRSNRLGWKFVAVKKIDQAVEIEATKALAALGLDFGAVDCCVDSAGKVWVLEANTGPGLEETTFKLWVDALSEKINSMLRPKTVAGAIKSTIGKVTGQKEQTTVAVKQSTGSNKESLAQRVRLMQEMVEKADEEEADVLNRVFAKMFN